MGASRYDIMTPREGSNGKTYWTRIGTMWPAKNGDGFSIEFEALPLPGKDGKTRAQCFVPKPREQSATQSQAAPTPAAVPQAGDPPVEDGYPF